MASLSELINLFKWSRNSFEITPLTTFQSSANINLLQPTLGDTAWTDLHNLPGAGGQHFQDFVVVFQGAPTIATGQVIFEGAASLVGTPQSLSLDWTNVTAPTVQNTGAFNVVSNQFSTYRVANTMGLRYVRCRISTAFTGANTGVRLNTAIFEPKSILAQILRVTIGNSVSVATLPTVAAVTTVSTVSSASMAAPASNTDITSASIIANNTTTAFGVSSGSYYVWEVNVTGVTGGTNPTLSTTIQYSTNSGTTWTDLHTIRANAVGTWRSPPLNVPGNQYRYVQTVTGSPTTFTRSVTRLVFQGALPSVSQASGATPIAFLFNTPSVLGNSEGALGITGITVDGISQGGAGGYFVPTGKRLVITSVSFAGRSNLQGANTASADDGYFALRYSQPGVGTINTSQPAIAIVPWSSTYVNNTATDSSASFNTCLQYEPNTLTVPSGCFFGVTAIANAGAHQMRVFGSINGFLING